MAVIAAILLVAALVLPSTAAAHPGHGKAHAMFAGDEAHANDDHAVPVADGATAVVGIDDSGARRATACAGAGCSIACSMGCAGSALGPYALPGALPGTALIRLDLEHIAAFPDAPERRRPKPPRA